MEKTVVFYSPKECKELKEIKDNFKGKERTSILKTWAKSNNRPFLGAQAKMYASGKKSNRMVNMTVTETGNGKTATLTPTTNGTIRVKISSISIKNGEMVIYY